MCRMLAMISLEPIDTRYLLDFRQLAATGKVAKGRKPGHTDGWGIVAYTNGVPKYMGRQPTNALHDPLYEKACENMNRGKISGISFCQLRKRSVGRKNILNTPPLVMKEFCFMHNGTIHKLGNAERSDSIQLFRMIVNEVNGGKSITDSLKIIYERISTSYRYTSMTSILTNGKAVYATKYVGSDQDEEYYDLIYARKGDLFVISQEDVWQLDWRRINNSEILVVDSTMKPIIEHVSL